MALLSVFLEILQRPRISDVFVEFVRFIAPLFVAVVVGVLFGWAWKPKWARWGREMAVSSTFKSSIADLISLKMPFTGYITWFSDDNGYKDSSSLPHGVVSPSSSSKVETQKPALVNEEDLQHLCRLVEVKDGGPDWIQMMDRSTPTMGYQAWRRDPESGPPQYRSRTVFEDATPELVRDFFWDDEFRSKWDDMLVYASTLEDCTSTGTMVVHWVRKFPFFCSDREYVIGRRIWESQRRYYCVTKGVPNSVPRRNKPRRVDLYYSSWCIRAVESRRGDGQLTACEVILFHHEDMGIPWEIAKIGVRQGMWRAVKKIEPGLRAFQKARTTAAAPLSRCCLLAQINTRVGEDYLRNLENDENESSSERELSNPSENYLGRSIPKLLVVGGAVLLACSLDKGLLTKAVIFGVGRRFAKIGKRL